MYSTLHECSPPGVSSQLSLFQLPPTNLAFEQSDFLEIHPSAHPGNTDSVTFYLSSLGNYFLDLSSSFIYWQGRILRSDGTECKTVTTGTTPTTTHDLVIPVDNFISSLWSFVDIYLNNTLVSSHELYSYRAFLDVILNTRDSQSHFLMFSHRDAADHSEKFASISELGENDGGNNRFHRSEGSKVMDGVAPLYLDIAQQTKLLPPGVDVQINLRQNPEVFRLLYNAGDEAKKFKTETNKVRLYVRKVQVAPSVLLDVEKALKTRDCTMLLRGSELKVRSLPKGSFDCVFENICPNRVASRIMVAIVHSEALQGSYKKNPFKFVHLNIRRATLTIGTREITYNYNFEENAYAVPFMHFRRFLQNPDVKFSRRHYESDSFLCVFDLTPGQDKCALSPVEVQNTRLSLDFRSAIPDNHNVLIFTDTPKVVQIAANRSVTIM